MEEHTMCGWRTYTREIAASGFPGLRALQGRARRAQLDGYLLRIVDRRLPGAWAPGAHPTALRR